MYMITFPSQKKVYDNIVLRHSNFVVMLTLFLQSAFDIKHIPFG